MVVIVISHSDIPFKDDRLQDCEFVKTGRAEVVKYCVILLKNKLGYTGMSEGGWLPIPCVLGLAER